MKRKLFLTLFALMACISGAFAGGSHSGVHFTKEVAQTSGYGKVYAGNLDVPNDYFAHWFGSSKSYWSGSNSGATSAIIMNCEGSYMTHTLSYIVTFMAEPDYGCRFLGWKRNPSDKNYFSTETTFHTGKREMGTNCSTSSAKAPIRGYYYAYFAPNHYTIKFDKNSDEATGTQSDINATCNIDYTLPSRCFARTGYCLKSWNTQPDGTGTTYYRGSTQTNLTIEDQATVTLYAQWVKNVDPVYEQKVFSFHANETYETVFTSTNTLNDFTLSIKNPSSPNVAEILPGNKLKINGEGTFDIYVDQEAFDEFNPVIDKKLASCVTSTYDFLSMKAVGGDVTIGSAPYGNPSYVLQYSNDRINWTDYAVKNQGDIVTIPEGQTYFFRTASSSVLTSVMDHKVEQGTVYNEYWNFTMSSTGNGTIEAGGNIMSLLDQTCQSTTVGYQCFLELFSGCTLLTVAPNLPATTLDEDCYNGMFYGCEKLQKAPFLPAKQLKRDCYVEMFNGCSSLNYVEADLQENLPYYNDYHSLVKTYFKENTKDWLLNTAATGVIIIQRENIIWTDSGYDDIDIPDGWKEATCVQLEEASENSGVFYSAFGYISGVYKNFDTEPQSGFKAMYVQVADGKALLSEAPDNTCHGQAMVIYGHSNRAVVTHRNLTQQESDDNILQFGEETVPDDGYILKHGDNGFGFYKSAGETISKYKGYFVYADGPEFMPIYNLSYLAPMWAELDNHVASVMGDNLSEQVQSLVVSIKTDMNEAPNEEAARAILDAGIADFDQRVANHQHSYTKFVHFDDVQHHIYCTNEDGFCTDIDHGFAVHNYGEDPEREDFYTCSDCGHLDENRHHGHLVHNSFSFTAVGGDVTIGFNRVGLPNDSYSIMLSTDLLSWGKIELEANNSLTIEDGQTMYFCYGGERIHASNNGSHENALNYDDNNGWRITMSGTGTIKAGGNIVSLIDPTVKLTTVNTHAFSHLFEDCKNLTQITLPELTSAGANAFSHWLNGTAHNTEGKLIAPLDKIGSNLIPASCVPSNWKWATILNATKDPDDPGTGYYTTFYDGRYVYTLPEDVNAYTATIEEKDGDKVVMLTAIDGTTLPKDAAVMLHSLSADEMLMTVSDANVNKPESNLLRGYDVATEQSGVLHYTFEYGELGLGFYPLDSSLLLDAQKAYLPFENPSEAILPGYRIEFDSNPTKINPVIFNDDEMKTGIYNLNGIRLNKIQKGFNIVNGKKVFVK